MGLLNNTISQYYQSDDLGNYQFVSLEDIINQFMVVYVGDQKIISKASRIDVAFHAQRALAELSFDTFKSIKSQEIVLPSSLQMMLPHDYVNYTKVLWTDGAGIKHPIYPTKHTQNPFSILQQDDGSYDLDVSSSAFLSNYNFESTTSLPQDEPAINQWVRRGPFGVPSVDDIKISGNELRFTHGSKVYNANSGYNYAGSTTSRIYGTYQRINVAGATSIDLTATATSAAASAGIKGAGLIRIGVSTLYYDLDPTFGESINLNITNPDITQVVNGYFACAMIDPAVFNLVDGDGDASYLEFSDGATSTLSMSNINVAQVPEDTSTGDKYVYVYIFSTVNDFTTASDGDGNESTNTIDSVTITGDQPVNYLQENEGGSTTWSNYKSATPSENQDDYQDDTYWPIDGSRFGLDPSHAQANGSFFIDQRLGKIHFSSNISGKTVVLDYISDSLGTDAEMKVHKFAEEAMYRWILHGIAAGRIQTQQLVPRLKKEKFAAVRQAKLRLSNIKTEELTQILRGKSKQIKH